MIGLVRGRESPSGAAAAAAAAGVASLLRGGLPAVRALAVLAEERTETPLLADVAGRTARGEPAPLALAAQDGPEWRAIAVAWRLADESGAQLAPALDRIATALRDIADSAARRDALLAGPRATVRLVCTLPPVAGLLGGLLGFDPLPVLLSPAGVALMLIGFALLWCGIRWAKSMQNAASQGDRVHGLELELGWIVVNGGAPPESVRRRVVDAVDALGAEWIGFDRFLADSPLASALESARSTGVPLGPMLLEAAAAERSAARAELERAAERLGVRVLVPLGVCVLPSFIVLGVAPVLITMLRGVGG